MGTEKIKELEEKLDELRTRWPAHSVPVSMWQQLEELEEELDRVRKETGEGK